MAYQFTPPPQSFLDVSSNLQRFIDSQGVTAAIDTAHRLGPLLDSIQARVAVFESTRPILDPMASFSRVASVLQRQQETMAIIATSSAWPVPTPADLEKAGTALLAQLPETDAEVEQMAQAVAGIDSDPKRRDLVERVTTALKKADLSKVPRAVIPVLMYWWLCHSLGLPLNGEVVEARSADYLGVVTIVLMVLFYLWPSD